jgi:hypothetical protein
MYRERCFRKDQSMYRQWVFATAAVIAVLSTETFASHEASAGPMAGIMSIQLTAACATPIHVGDPVLLKILITYNTPCTGGRLDADRNRIRLSDMAILVEAKGDFKTQDRDQDERSMIVQDGIRYRLCPIFGPLTPTDRQGRTCTMMVPIQYNLDTKQPWFDRTETYKLRIATGAKDGFSNILEIPVSQTAPQCDPGLLKPMDLTCLMNGSVAKLNKPDANGSLRDRFLRYASRNKQTLLGQWMAACVAAADAEALEIAEHDLRMKRQRICDTYRDEVIPRLVSSLQMPNEFQIREDILWRLTEIEFKRQNYRQAIHHLDELAEAYPLGRRGRDATRSKEEVQKELQKEERIVSWLSTKSTTTSLSSQPENFWTQIRSVRFSPAWTDPASVSQMRKRYRTLIDSLSADELVAAGRQCGLQCDALGGLEKAAFCNITRDIFGFLVSEYPAKVKSPADIDRLVRQLCDRSSGVVWRYVLIGIMNSGYLYTGYACDQRIAAAKATAAILAEATEPTVLRTVAASATTGVLGHGYELNIHDDLIAQRGQPASPREDMAVWKVIEKGRFTLSAAASARAKKILAALNDVAKVQAEVFVDAHTNLAIRQAILQQWAYMNARKLSVPESQQAAVHALAQYAQYDESLWPMLLSANTRPNQEVPSRETIEAMQQRAQMEATQQALRRYINTQPNPITTSSPLSTPCSSRASQPQPSR